MKSIVNRCVMLLLPVLLISAALPAAEQAVTGHTGGAADARPPEALEVHSIGNIGMAVYNLLIWGDPYENYQSMDWPEGSENSYLWCGDLWSSCYGEVTAADSVARYASCSDYGNWELRPSDGYPLVYETPGSMAPEQSEYGADDWDTTYNDQPYGIGFFVKNLTWDDQGYDNFMVNDITVTHHSEFGNQGVPLDGLVISIRGDFDVASADSPDHNLDDMVYYDGHAIWCNGSDAVFEYVFDSGITARDQDEYTYQQNPDNPLPSGDPENIYYHYNYAGADGIPDNDVDQDGVSDQFTILAKVVGGDTLYRTDPGSGITLFSEGMPYWHYQHTVGDTTYLVVPRNLSYMWDSDSPGSAEDDSGEPMAPLYCNGFSGWRLLDVWVARSGGQVERPCDVYGYPIPLSHQWWNWESDPGTDEEKYLFMWGKNPDEIGDFSGPSYMTDWIGNPNAPDAMEPDNPGPFPFVFDSPLNLSYPTFDYRFLQSVGPVELADGDTLHIVGGWVIGLGLDGLRMNADLLLDAYYRDSIWGQGLGVETAGPSPLRDLSVFPNPVTSMGTVDFRLQTAGRTVISVYDIAGRCVSDVMDRELSAGTHSVDFDTSRMGSGVYFVRVLGDGWSATGRFVVLD